MIYSDLLNRYKNKKAQKKWDAVVTWVDGNAPTHRAARYKYSHNGEEFKYEDVASDTRFTSVGEIKGCMFRDSHQYNPQVLNCLLGFQKALFLLVPTQKHFVCLMPKPHRGEDYVSGKLQGFENKTSAPFCCFNSLDKASESNLILSWIHSKLGVEEFDCYGK